MRHRDVNVADRNRNPLHEMDVLPGKAAVEIRFNRLLEEFLTYQIRMALADDLVRRHLPVALVDRIDPLKTVIPAEHRHGLLRALEHLIRYVFRSLALGLALSAFVDIQADAQKVDHATLVVAEWVRACQEPSIFAVRATESLLDAKGASALDRVRPTPHRLLTVLWMDQIQPAKTQDVAHRAPCVLAAPLVQIPRHAVRRRSPHEDWKGLEQVADEHLAHRHCPRYFLGAAGDRSMEPTQALSGLGFHVSHGSTSSWPVSIAFCTFTPTPTSCFKCASRLSRSTM